MTEISELNFGKGPKGADVTKYTLKNPEIEVSIINYGATITSLKCGDKNGVIDDIVTGFDSMQEYMTKKGYFGCVVGRVANRIAEGMFSLNGKTYRLVRNNGPNCLHGGTIGFDKKMWSATKVNNGVKFELESPDKEEGFPGNMHVIVTYILEGNQLAIHYDAKTDQDTPINLTNHSYFNLSGHNKWSHISDHVITIHADKYTPVNENTIPRGVENVDGTPFDLRCGKQLTVDNLAEVGNGYDHNFCLKEDHKKKLVAKLEHVGNGRCMTVETTQPGVQFYTANFLTDTPGKEGVTYGKNTAVCLETQNWPNAINMIEFPKSVLKKGETYNEVTWFTFGVGK